VTWVALTLMAIGGALSLWLHQRPHLDASPESLVTLPHRLGSFEGVDAPLEAGVEKMLQADFNLQRLYAHPLGGFVSLYVGYYGTARGGTPEHTPSACYSAQGWSILERATLPSGLESAGRVREYVVESQGRRELVMFWYRSFRRSGMVSTARLRLDHLLGQLESGRGDGALVRISTPLTGVERSAARSLLFSFARSLEPELGARWPMESADRRERGEADTFPVGVVTHSAS
jgi:EpsI family protein